MSLSISEKKLNRIRHLRLMMAIYDDDDDDDNDDENGGCDGGVEHDNELGKRNRAGGNQPFEIKGNEPF